MRSMRLAGLLFTVLATGCAASMELSDAAVKKCVDTLPVHETAERNDYAAVREVSGAARDFSPSPPPAPHAGGRGLSLSIPAAPVPAPAGKKPKKRSR